MVRAPAFAAGPGVSRAVRKLVTVEGIVQGVGFRPFVHGLASSLDLAGSAHNHARGVDIEVEGAAEAVARFEALLVERAPPLSHITKVNARSIEPRGERGFTIRHSDAAGVKTASVAPDADVCPDCLRELFDPADRRHRYPFINCVNCGPRFTIVTGIPYDRPQTTMTDFEMCGACRAEYENPSDRRFHAQPVACPDCGPRLALLDNSFAAMDCADPLREAARLLREGSIVGVKGIGGFHLAVDAANESAVTRLRERKRRDEKPFAVMFRDVERLGKYARFDEREAAMLTSRPKPIVLLPAREDSPLGGVAPRNRLVGAMLPYTPVHHLLFAEGGFDALVMTSANISDDPIVFRDGEAVERLRGVADYLLTHDRRIHTRADDSIERPMAHGPVTLRRSRGYAPAPILLDHEYPATLGVGAELKNTFCLIKGDRAYLSQHIGDLKYDAVYQSYLESIERFLGLMEVGAVEAIGHDLHPDYLSGKYAKERGGALIGVQHHHAHQASLMAEHHLDGEMLGVVFDGTGYGADGGIWGGEFLVGGRDGFTSGGHTRPVALPGGDKAVKEPYRIALGVLYELFGDTLPELPLPWLKALDNNRRALFRTMVRRGVNTPLSRGAGRLFDAAAALCGLRDVISFEGQAAMELEMAIDSPSDESYPVGVEESDGNGVEADFRPAFRALVDDVALGATVSHIAVKFHNSVAEAALAAMRALRAKAGLTRVGLSGGVFQNRYLSDRLGEMLSRDGFTVYRHSRVPPNDGGVALGQALVAARRLIQGA
ncbi:MAG: carbamoyltransferase HypF [Nitrospinae bacterium]|nr:carbamoyltransferase HypF [Nitrospinota bacterium]